MAGAGIALRYLMGDLRDVVSVLRFKPWTPLAVGLALAAGTALGPMVTGVEPLDHRAYELSLWLIGDVKLTTASLFDTGVYLVVVGLVLMILEAFADESEPGIEVEPTDDVGAAPRVRSALGTGEADS